MKSINIMILILGMLLTTLSCTSDEKQTDHDLADIVSEGPKEITMESIEKILKGNASGEQFLVNESLIGMISSPQVILDLDKYGLEYSGFSVRDAKKQKFKSVSIISYENRNLILINSSPDRKILSALYFELENEKYFLEEAYIDGNNNETRYENIYFGVVYWDEEHGLASTQYEKQVTPDVLIEVDLEQNLIAVNDEPTSAFTVFFESSL